MTPAGVFFSNPSLLLSEHFISETVHRAESQVPCILTPSFLFVLSLTPTFPSYFLLKKEVFVVLLPIFELIPTETFELTGLSNDRS